MPILACVEAVGQAAPRQELGDDEASMAGDEAAAWLPLGEASRRLGISVDALRARVRRGLVELRKGNDGRIVVLVDDETMSRQSLGGDESDDRARQERDEARAEADHWRGVAEAARIAAATYKEQAEAARSIAAAQAEAKDVLIAELRELLAEARRPWWRKLIGR
jgi:hypothetical protein